MGIGRMMTMGPGVARGSKMETLFALMKLKNLSKYTFVSCLSITTKLQQQGRGVPGGLMGITCVFILNALSADLFFCWARYVSVVSVSSLIDRPCGKDVNFLRSSHTLPFSSWEYIRKIVTI